MEDGLFEPATLAQLHFGKARLFDKRRTKRLVKVAQRIMARPRETLPQKLADRADLVGLYRLLDCEKVTHERVLGPHRERTLQAAREHAGVVLFIHDTTELDFTAQPALARQLGQVGKGFGRGWLCHNTLAVGLGPAGHRRVLGLASQVLHRRREVPKNETPRQKRAHPERESRLWLEGCERTGTPPTGWGVRWVDVADRGSDTIEFIEYEVRNGRSFVTRLAKDRNLDGGDHVGIDRIHRKVMSWAKDQPVLGMRQVLVPAVAGGHAARVAAVGVSAAPLRLRAGRSARGECTGLPLELWVVLVRETEPPPGIEPLRWVLLTNMPAGTFEQASKRVDWYEHRPVIEDYHKGQKSGLAIERSRFRNVSRLEPMVALLSVVTAVLLGLRDMARRPEADFTPATDLVPELYTKVLAAHSAKRAREKGPRARPPVTEQMSAREFLMEVAKLGGFQARKSDGHPGWQTLWHGWSDLQLMVEAVVAMSG
jgi:hypothetical protein